MPRLPMPPTDKEALAKNIKEQYEALGRFVRHLKRWSMKFAACVLTAYGTPLPQIPD